MKVLLLILSSNGEYYRAFKETWKSYMNSHKHIDSFFIELHPDISNLEKDDNVLAFEGEECIVPGCLQKTVWAMQKYLGKYDYVVRTNLSSVIHLPRLYKHLEKITDPIYYAGYVGHENGIIFGSGAMYIMSKEVAFYAAQNASTDHDMMDDVYIGSLIGRKYGYMLKPLKRQSCLLGNINVDNSTCFHYRFKSSDRGKDNILHKQCAAKIYSDDVSSHKCQNYLQSITAVRNYYMNACTIPSDINEHLPTFYKYALECDSVVECGVRSVVSSWGFLMGLAEGLCSGPSHNKFLMGCDLRRSANINILENLARDAGVKFEFVTGDDTKVSLPEADLYFIDTWHVYAHLKAELNLFKHKARKYILMHDTTVDRVYGESVRCKWNTKQQALTSGYAEEDIRRGLQPAIDEFLEENPEWTIESVFVNNNGLTILKRM